MGERVAVERGRVGKNDGVESRSPPGRTSADPNKPPLEHATSSIAKWLVDVAQAANTWYQDVPILKADDPQVRHARLVLAQAVHEALARGCALLGITMVGRM